VANREELLLLGEIAGEAAHELRNALAVIAASASLMKSASLAPSDAGHLAKIERNARLAQNVLDALMSLARGEAVRGAPVAISSAMSAARAELSANVAYVDEVGDAAVRGSEVLLARLFRVLYDNAAQAGAKNITTRARTESGVVTVDVIDDGPGVPEAIRATLFEPLVTTKTEGTGLGLALARRVARAHGGDIALADATHFVITLR
jgi:signal transduction histidine kinase